MDGLTSVAFSAVGQPPRVKARLPSTAETFAFEFRIAALLGPEPRVRFGTSRASTSISRARIGDQVG